MIKDGYEWEYYGDLWNGWVVYRAKGKFSEDWVFKAVPPLIKSECCKEDLERNK